jgi:fucose 4-O-acetylase-like acetyltransferase
MSDDGVITTERNTYVDVIRGIVMILVILGHTMIGCTQGAENSLLYNVIWPLQVPFIYSCVWLCNKI